MTVHLCASSLSPINNVWRKQPTPFNHLVWSPWFMAREKIDKKTQGALLIEATMKHLCFYVPCSWVHSCVCRSVPLCSSMIPVMREYSRESINCRPHIKDLVHFCATPHEIWAKHLQMCVCELESDSGKDCDKGDGETKKWACVSPDSQIVI